MYYKLLLYNSFIAALSIGFEGHTYTVFEAFNATGELIGIPIIRSFSQHSETTLEVSVSIVAGNSLNSETADGDFFAYADTHFRTIFHPDEERTMFLFELFDDDTPEGEEFFKIELSRSLTTRGVSVGGRNVFSSATVRIVDDDG